MKQNKYIKVMCCLVMFTSGVAFDVNLSRLIPTNPNYHASWFNVCVMLVIFMYAFMVILFDKK